MQVLNKAIFFIKRNWIIIFLLTLLTLITLLTGYEGSTDVGDYSDVAKYFSGDYAAKIRSSHSYFYGFLVSPLIALFGSFIVFKILSLIFLLLIVYSVYLITGKNKKTFWLMIFSPIIWYMVPWVNSIQLSALLFLWAYIFVKKYDKTEKFKFLILSGILVGLSWAFWDAILFFSVIFAISFLYNKKFYHFILFFIFLLVGLLPKLILDHLLFNFVFMGILRYLSGIVTAVFFQGIYGNMGSSYSFATFLAILAFLPIFSYKLFSRENWRTNKKPIIFLFLVFLVILKNPQLRYLLFLTPIIITELAPKLTERQFKKQLAVFSVITILVTIPYIIQINNSTNAEEFSSLLSNFNSIKISESQRVLIEQDLENITNEFQNKVFIVGNEDDDYQKLAHIYWGEKVKEFVSIQDYRLFLNNQTVLFEKEFMPIPNIRDRRQIWLAGGINKNKNDDTNYTGINFGIGMNEPINLEDFSVVKKYNILYLSERSG